LIFHGDLWVTTIIDDLDGILVSLCIVRHDAFKAGLFYVVFSHEFIELSLYHTLNHCVLKLHVTHGNGHDLAICCIIHVTSHYGPILDKLDMVKHEPHVL
jgi:hypothetical protein